MLSPEVMKRSGGVCEREEREIEKERESPGLYG